MSLSCPPVRRSFSDEPGPGTFHSMGVLPKRRHNPSPVFHIVHDDDDDHSSSADECALPLVPTPPANVPFPRSTPPPVLQPSSPSRPTPRTPLCRGASAPILLPNGKPLKSSLKSSPSSPPMTTPPEAQRMHLRTRSEPFSPGVTPKNVHFPEKDYALATVRVYNRSARPAALSNPANGNGDETETEAEDTPSIRFPFPRVPPICNYEIDPTKSSPVPSKISPPINLLLESLNISSFPSPGSTAKPSLTGSLLVCNLAFEKQVAVRFTLDDWQTVSEVGAHYIGSLPNVSTHTLPSSPSSSCDLSTQRGRGWDRFTFTIRLEDYAHSLSARTLWLAVRYRVDSTYPEPGSVQYGPGGEWWDNNGGMNYRVGFRPAVTASSSPQSKSHMETVSATPSACAQLQLPGVRKEHALALIMPPVLRNKENLHENDTDGRSTPLRAGRLNLCNYAPPTARVAPSVSVSSAGFPQSSSPSSIANQELPPSEALRATPDEDTTSPASSTLSTPSVSPTITPRVIIGGQPATPDQPHDSSEKEGSSITPFRPRHLVDWDWSASGKPQTKLPRQLADLVPDSEFRRRRDIPSPQGKGALSQSSSLYNAFITQWCFAQGSSPSHNVYGDVGLIT